MIRLCWFSLFLVSASSIAWGATREHPAQRAFKRVTLRNGLDTYLISDPEARQEALSLAVNAGGLNDPLPHLGLAHLVEHMLLTASTQFPAQNAFRSFLSHHRGWVNAATTQDTTRFYMEVDASGLWEGLERFSAFFVAPLFKQEAVEAEKQAIYEELAMRQRHSIWQESQLLAELGPKDSGPETRFFIGSEASLKRAGLQEVQHFFDRHYSARNMRLAVISSLPLTALELAVEGSMGRIRPHCPQKNEAAAAGKPIPTQDKERTAALTSQHPWQPLWVSYQEPSNSSSSRPRVAPRLAMIFSLPRGASHRAMKDAETMLVSLLRETTPGSLREVLHQEGLADDVQASLLMTAQKFTHFQLSFCLTPQGLSRNREVVRLVFAYLRLLSRNGLTVASFLDKREERRRILHYERPKQGSELTNEVVDRMLVSDAYDLTHDSEILRGYDPDGFSTLLRQLQPQRTLFLLNTSGQQEMEPGQHTEPHLKLSYDLAVLDRTQTWFAELDTASDTRLRYPPANPWLQQSPLHPPSPAADGSLITLQDDESLRLWIKMDHQHQPVGFISVKIFNGIAANAKNIATAMLVQELINDELFTYSSQLHAAGFQYLVRVSPGLAHVHVSGYHPDIYEVTKRVIAKIFTFTAGAQVVQHAKDKLIAASSDLSFRDEAEQLFAAYHYLVHPDTMTDVELVQALVPLSPNDATLFKYQLQDRLAWEGLAYGALSPTALHQHIQKLVATTNAKRLPALVNPEQVLIYPAGTNWSLHRQSAGGSHAWGAVYQLACHNTEAHAYQLLALPFLEEEFHAELRSRQQLAYDLGVVGFNEPNDLAIGMYIVSHRYPATVLEAKATEWLAEARRRARKISQSHFEELRQSILHDLVKEPANMGELFDRIYDQLTRSRVGLSYHDELITAVKSLTRDRFAEMLSTMTTGPSSRRLDVRLIPGVPQANDATNAQRLRLIDAQAKRTFMSLARYQGAAQ